jgi:hypothetical protein
VEAAHQGRLAALAAVALEEYPQDAWLGALVTRLGPP